MIRLIYLLSTVLILLQALGGQSVFAQVDTTIAHKLYLQASMLAKEADFQGSIPVLKQAGNQYREAGAWGRFVTCLNEIGVSYTEMAMYDKAEEVLTKAIQIGETHLTPPDADIAHTYLCQGYLQANIGEYVMAKTSYEVCFDMRKELYGVYHPEMISVITNLGTAWSSLGDERKAIHWHKLALEIHTHFPEDSSFDPGTIYNNLAVSMGRIGDLEQSLSYMLKVYESDKETFGEEHPYIANDCNNIGYLYGRTGDYERAISFHQQSLRINEQTLGSMHPAVARNHSNIGSCLWKEGLYDSAIQAYEVALRIRQKSEPGQYGRFAFIHSNMGLIYLEQERFQEAEEQLQQSFQYTDLAYDAFHPDRGLVLEHLGNCFLQQDRYKESLSVSLQAKAIYERNYQAPHEYLVNIHSQLAEINSELGNMEKAQTYVNQAIKSAMKTDSERDSPPVSMNYLTPYRSLLDVMIQKAHLEYQQALKSSSANLMFKQSLASCLFADKLGDTLRSSYQYRQSQVLLSAKLAPVYELGIKNSLALFRRMKDPSFLETAFHYSEKSKYLLLLDARNASEAKHFAGIPDSLVERERRLDLDITYYEKKLYSDPEEDEATMDDWRTSLFELREQRTNLRSTFQSNNPLYHHMLTVPQRFSLSRFQQEILQEDQTLLEYFIGEDSLYAFCVNHDTISIEVVDIQKDKLVALIEEFRASVYGDHLIPYPDEQSYGPSVQSYARLAHELYQVLIEPVSEQLTSRVTIVPDGVLGYLPFASLLKNPPEQADRFNRHDFLIKYHSLGQAFSAQILQTFTQTQLSSQGTEKRYQVLGIAPSFEFMAENESSHEFMRSESLSALPFTKKEIRAISDIFPHKNLLGQEATLENFLALAPNYSILHIATHAKANEQNPEFSYLVFSPQESSELELLYIRDLYNLKLQADLAVLSACETGVGKLQRGEGIISLAQGFAYAGVPSVLTTLWSVNDQQTSSWMELFYQQLKSGVPKDVAIQQAHLQYLTSHQEDLYCHPFFWASYTAIGDMRPIEMPSQFPIWGIGLILLGLLALIVGLRKKLG